MNVSEELKKTAEMASLYGLLAKYYEYRDPKTHFYYYQKHFQYAAKAAELAQMQDPAPRSSTVEAAGVNVTPPTPTGTSPYGTNQEPISPYGANPGAISPYGMNPPAGLSPYGVYPPPMSPYGAIPNMAHPYGTYPGALNPYAAVANSGPNASSPGGIYASVPAAGAAKPAAPADTAKVRAIHAIPGAPAVDIYVDGQKLLSSVSYRTSSEYITVPAGNYKVNIYEAGTTSPALLSKSVTAAPGAAYTVAAAGTIEEADIIVFTDEPYAPPGSVKVRFLHLSPDAPAVDVATRSGSVLFQNVGFGTASRYITIAPGTYDFVVRAAGTNNIVLTASNVRLSGGKTYTIAALGLSGGTPALEAKVITG